ncbi:hypothetical protein ES831_09220, partial [Campylobacter jejuni]|nr:hypothetical protein [Campylobacter jejuni]EAI0926968.1 hypothetical protein [Campylobacter jejuni]EAI3002328.1 hypothetical protein [Campylobacter jejuni]EAK5804385.1 hypothetical protein [Campylobacter jejuni]EAK5998533.1 hypothetical protein [Campylobacter jejuni]
MFHVCYSSSAEYIKYVAVSIFNIIKMSKKDNLKYFFDNHQPIPYHFHVFIENDNLEAEKLKSFIEILKQYYPCELSLHIISQSDISFFSHCALHQGARNAYYVLLMARYLSSKCDKFLYLGVDILVVQDIREIFEIDLKDNAIAAPLACRNYKGSMATYKSINSNIPDYTFSMEYRFCPDPMLVNVKEWLTQDIEKKCQYYITNFHAISAYEGCLNAVLYDNYLVLEPKWGLWIGRFLGEMCGWWKDTYKGETDKPLWGYTREEFEKNLQDVKIWHFTSGCAKPWQSPYIRLDKNGMPCEFEQQNLWWEYALQTPIFKEELQELKNNLENTALAIYKASVKNMIKAKDAIIQKHINTINTIIIEKKQVLQINTKLQQKLNTNSSCLYLIKAKTAKARIQNQLSYKLGQAMIVNSKSILGYIRMPFVLSYIKDKHNQEQKVYQEKIKKDPSLKLPPLESYPDYKEALKEKECFTYKLGQ